MTGPAYQPLNLEIIMQNETVRVAEITLPPHSPVPEHQHTESEEISYCLEGELSCRVDGRLDCVLKPGQKTRFPAGQEHQLSNAGEVPCRFLLIHGVGKFDFVPVKRG